MVVIPACPESVFFTCMREDSGQAGMTLTAYKAFINTVVSGKTYASINYSPCY